MSILGTRVVRTEDPRLLTAGGTYVEDLRVPELATAARVTFVRSPIAHAMITRIDASARRLRRRPRTASAAARAPRCRSAAPGRNRCWPPAGCASSASRWRS